MREIEVRFSRYREKSGSAGLVSVLTTLGMPEDKAAIYQTRLQAGDFLVMAEVGGDRASEFQRRK
ncbi:MAG: hypothetical protein V7K19_19670 [Nostoc sp.]